LAVARPTSSGTVAVSVARVFTMLTLRDATTRARVAMGALMSRSTGVVVFSSGGSFGHDACLSYE
jgi:hypothetical protein